MAGIVAASQATEQTRLEIVGSTDIVEPNFSAQAVTNTPQHCGKYARWQHSRAEVKVFQTVARHKVKIAAGIYKIATVPIFDPGA